jgi:hypothetical protein
MNGDIVGDIEPAPRARRDKRPYNSFDAGSSFLFSPFRAVGSVVRILMASLVAYFENSFTFDV